MRKEKDDQLSLSIIPHQMSQENIKSMIILTTILYYILT